MPYDLLKLRKNLSHFERFPSPSTPPVHEPKRVTGHLQHCQPGTGKAALFAHTGRFLTVNEASLRTALSAFWGPWAG
jgi:hypothetical protein